ncbi:MAG: sugar ABC transporter permease [Desulfurococcaceae archaeon]
MPENPPKSIKVLSSLPLNLLLNGVLIVPFIIMIYLAFLKWSPLMGMNWWEAPFYGLQNFARAVSDARFLSALGRTALFVAISVPLEFVLGLILAYFMQREFVGKKYIVSLLIYPLMLPPVVVATVFYLFFQPYGPVNNIFLKYLVGEKALDIYWFLDRTLAFITIIIAEVWQWTPFMFLILYSGLSAIPKRLVEAAEVLGASEWKIFWKIRLPLIKQLITIAIILRCLEAFKVFDYIYVMTGGGPGTATESISLYIYRLAIMYSDISYAAAVSLIVLAIIFAVSRIAIKFLLERR